MDQMVKSTSIKPEVRREYHNTVNHNTVKEKADLHQLKSSPVRQILSLQRDIGNQAVGRLIKSGTLQAKLKIGQPGDIYEKEADRVAEQVMQMSGPQIISKTAVPTEVIQRSCPKCEKEMLNRQENEEQEVEPLISLKFSNRSPPPIGENEEKLQRKAINDCTSEVCPNLQSKIDNLKGGGQPLPESARTFFEPRFGYDFSHVRIHAGGNATAVARALNARAFTVGSDVAFGSGEYAPGTPVGDKLLAHELAHVVQQSPSLARQKYPGQNEIQVNTKTKEGAIIQRAWVTGPPTPGINTIVCDGSGGISVQAGATGNTQQTACLRDCIITHENSHRADALAANATVCNGQTANRIVTVDTQPERRATEVKASNAEITCLRARPDTDACRATISARITQMESYRDSF
ncbi:MAG: DUF4157 domain-containing protein [Candidatus Methanoperedens sp.]